MSLHKELDDYILNVYKFEEVWKDKCSKYDVQSQSHILPAVKRIIVIGDIHGDWEMTQESLKIAKLIDDKGNWIGGENKKNKPNISPIVSRNMQDPTGQYSWLFGVSKK